MLTILYQRILSFYHLVILNFVGLYRISHLHDILCNIGNMRNFYMHLLPRVTQGKENGN